MLFSLPFEARQLEALALATAIGLLMGLERERRPAARAGVRTFGLTGLLGALMALLAELLATPAFIAMGFAVVAVMMKSMHGMTKSSPTVPLMKPIFGSTAIVIVFWASEDIPADSKSAANP